MTYKFGDMVYMKDEGGAYMVVGPYTGPRGANDSTLPAVWVADIDTQYMSEADGGTVWCPIDNLEPVDE